LRPSAVTSALDGAALAFLAGAGRDDIAAGLGERHRHRFADAAARTRH
jgi:hypothetical protein